MKLLYLAGPYRAKTIFGHIRNIWRAWQAAKCYWKQGYCVFTPHLNSALMESVCPDVYFLGGYLEILRHCDAIVMLPGWKNSFGSQIEYSKAIAWGKEIIYHKDEK